ncbi:MAG TPA: hypothetical protein GX745_02005 [Clostridiales bacterium]|nr:hypothetical protein [Clostridiales bacterium]
MDKKNKIKDSGIKYIFTRGLFLFMIGFMFDIMALPVLAIKSPFWSVIFSLIVIIPFMYVVFVSGRMSGAHCYKAFKRNLLRAKQGEPISKSQRFLEYHWAKGFIFSAVYYVWQVIILSLALMLKNRILNTIIVFYNLAFANILDISGAIQMSAVSNFSALFFIIIFAVPLIFEAGYILGGEKQKIQHQEIQMEIKLFNN